MNVQDDGKLDELKAFITKLASDTYEQTGEGLLLSRVGEIISNDHPDLRIALGNKKLAEFIEQEMSESVRLLISPENKIIRVILPENVVVADDDIMQYFPERNATSSKVRYNRAFWAAFSHSLAEGCTRLVGFDPVAYDDIQGDISSETIKKVVPNDSIIDEAREPVPAKRIRLINEKISEWLQANEVSVDLVEAKAETGKASAKLLGLDKRSLLEILLTALDDADLKRIQMPLDIVAKLSRRL